MQGHDTISPQGDAVTSLTLDHTELVGQPVQQIAQLLNDLYCAAVFDERLVDRPAHDHLLVVAQRLLLVARQLDDIEITVAVGANPQTTVRLCRRGHAVQADLVRVAPPVAQPKTTPPVQVTSSTVTSQLAALLGG
jgi:hypothetical protein